MENRKFRQLTEKEIATLLVYGCSADNWKDIEVADAFSPNFIANVHFSGKCTLGVYEHVFELPGGIKKHSGIYNCLLHNCTVGNDVFIDKINNYISNYTIQEKAYIENVNLILTEGNATFGNGTQVTVINEGGGREVPIFDYLSAPLAYLLAIYRSRPKLISSIEKNIHKYVQSVSAKKGTIGKNAKITNCGKIKNVRVGNFATVEGTVLLESGTINSNQLAPSFIGEGVQAKDFILSTGATVSGASILEKCFVGQGSVIDKQFSAVDSLFFANCQLMNGEAVSVFAGPYTVSHHKSTLLIAAMFSFMNAGSGSNQSNHLYKLGPMHQGIVGRGSKLASSSYILFPAEIGIFTTVLGQHKSHPDTSLLPFSYLIDNNGKSFIVPAANLKSVGIVRDAQKWQARDNRTDAEKLDPICFELFNPYSIGKILEAIERLKSLQKTYGKIDVYEYNGCFINRSSLEKAIEIYQLAILQFLGKQIVTRFDNFEKLETATTETGKGDWSDLSGLIVPKSEVEKLISSIENEDLCIDEIDKRLNEFHNNYSDYVWAWTVELLEKQVQKTISALAKDEIVSLLNETLNASQNLNELLLEDAKKEFSEQVKTSYGYENTDKNGDFEAIRGNYEENEFVKTLKKEIKQHKDKISKIIEEI